MTFDNTVTPHLPSMRRYALSLTRNTVDADDVVQDALEKALRMFATYDPTLPVRPWLHRIVHNVFIDRYRRSVRERRHDDDNRASGALAVGDLRHDVVALEAAQVLAEASIGVNPDLYEVLHRFSVRGETCDVIADAMGIPYGTVLSRLHRARRQLKDSLGAFSTLDSARVDTARGESAERVQSDSDGVDSVVGLRH